MPDKQPNLDEFSDLIHELETPRNQPRVSFPSNQFTANLRRNLLQNYESQPLSRRGMMNLWRFAGTAVALAVVVVAIGYIWLTMSSSLPTVSPDTAVAPEEVINETIVNPPLKDSIIITSVSPKTNTIISGTTNFEVQIHYTLVSLPEAEVKVAIGPVYGGPVRGNAVKTVTQGEGNITVTFDFQPLYTNQPSDWIMSVEMYAPDVDGQTRKILAHASPNKSLEDSWHYKSETAVSDDLPFIFDLNGDIKLIDYTLNAPDQSISITLRWLVVRQPQIEYTTAIHLLDDEGNLLAQFDRALGAETQPPPPWEPETFIKDTYNLELPEELEEGSYPLAVIFYNAQTGERFRQLTLRFRRFSDGGIGYGRFFPTQPTETGDTVATAVPQYAIVANTNNLGLTLRDNPAGTQIDILREGVAVELLASEPVTVDGNSWRFVKTANELTGWVMDDYLVPTDAGTNDRVWLISATQKERVTAMVSFEVQLGTEIESAQTAGYTLYLAHPNWETNGLIDRAALPSFQPIADNVFRLTAAPDQIRAATGTDNPVVVVEVWPAITATQKPLDQILPAIRETFTACPMDLTRSDEFTCTP